MAVAGAWREECTHAGHGAHGGGRLRAARALLGRAARAHAAAPAAAAVAAPVQGALVHLWRRRPVPGRQAVARQTAPAHCLGMHSLLLLLARGSTAHSSPAAPNIKAVVGMVLPSRTQLQFNWVQPDAKL